MQKNTVIFSAMGLILVMLGGYFYFYNRPTSSITVTPSPEVQLEGRAVFSVTDATAIMENISEVVLTIDKVEVESATKGWLIISQSPKKYNLLALHSSSTLEVLADLKLDVGKYNQVRLHVSDITVIDIKGASKKAKLPSNSVKIVGSFTIQPNQTSAITLDFLADKSLHTTGKGEYIFAPVVKFESKTNAQVGIASDHKVSITGGNIETSTSVGMDINGSVTTGFVLSSQDNLELVGNLIRVKLAGEKSDAGLKITAEKAATLAIEGKYLDTAVSIQLTTVGAKKIWRVSGLKGLLPASATVDATTGVVAGIQ